MHVPKFLTRLSLRRGVPTLAGALVLTIMGFHPQVAQAQLLPVTIDADGQTQCMHTISRADFSEPAPLRRGDQRKFRAVRLQYTTTARIQEARVATISTNGPPLRYTIPHPQFFYFRPWATPPEFVSFAQFEIPAEIPLANITLDSVRGGCASPSLAINDLALTPRMLAEESPIQLTPIFPEGMTTLRAAAPKPRATKLRTTAARPRVSVTARATPSAPSPRPLAASASPVSTPAIPLTPPVVATSAPQANATPCTVPDQVARVITLKAVNSRVQGKPINDRPTFGRIRVAINAQNRPRAAEVAESTGFPLLDKRLRESALQSAYATKISACEAVPSDLVVRYEIGF